MGGLAWDPKMRGGGVGEEWDPKMRGGLVIWGGGGSCGTPKWGEELGGGIHKGSVGCMEGGGFIWGGGLGGL